MIIRKLRLEHGWTQAELAEMTNLTTRTIQRIESGHRPSLESKRALASVFEVDLSSLQTESVDMNKNTELTLDEQYAMHYAKRVKDFYEGIFVYLVIAVTFFTVFWGNPKLIYIFGGIGLFMILQGLVAFEVISFMSPNWEKKIAQKRLSRLLQTRK